MPVNIEYQLPLLQPLPTVYGPKDYREFRDTLVQMDRIIENTGLEFKIIRDNFKRNGVDNPTVFAIESGRRMFRCAILKVLSGLDYREFDKLRTASRSKTQSTGKCIGALTHVLSAKNAAAIRIFCE